MTHEEAIKQLSNVTIYHQGECTREALDIAINAIKKQIPKKPLIIKTGDFFGHVICPNCEEVEFGFKQPCFCDNCGQAIDWSVSE